MDKILNFVLRTAVFIVATMPHILELLNQSKNGKSEILDLSNDDSSDFVVTEEAAPKRDAGGRFTSQ